MAITMNLLVGGLDEANATSYTTASITPTSNALVLFGVHHVRGSSPPATPTLTSNAGLNSIWTQIATEPYNTPTTPISRSILFRSLHASPGSGTVTIDFGGETQVRAAWIVAEFLVVDTGGTNGSVALAQFATDVLTASGTTLAPILAAFGDAVNNATYIFACINNDTALNNEAGYTEISEQNPVTESFRTAAAWLLGQDTTPTYTFASSVGAAIAVEIKAAVSGTHPGWYVTRGGWF